MAKAGIIVGVVALLFGVGVALLSPLCVPCITLLLGIAAGFLAGVFDKPAEGNETLKTGAFAGLIGGAGLVLGQLAGAIINAIVVGPEGAAQLLENLGMQTGGPASIEGSYWIGVVGSTVCLGGFDLVLMAGFGVLGALAWGKFIRKDDDSLIEVIQE
jgi:hypothetical protein